MSSLSMELAMSQEDHLSCLPLNRLVESLIICLQKDYSAEIVLNATICLTNLLELGSLSSLIAELGGIHMLVSKLTHFEFIEVAEHAVRALSKICSENAPLLLSEDAFSALVSMVDFFDSTLQKQIMGMLVLIAQTVPNLALYQELSLIHI